MSNMESKSNWASIDRELHGDVDLLAERDEEIGALNEQINALLRVKWAAEDYLTLQDNGEAALRLLLKGIDDSKALAKLRAAIEALA